MKCGLCRGIDWHYRPVCAPAPCGAAGVCQPRGIFPRSSSAQGGDHGNESPKLRPATSAGCRSFLSYRKCRFFQVVHCILRSRRRHGMRSTVAELAPNSGKLTRPTRLQHRRSRTDPVWLAWFQIRKRSYKASAWLLSGWLSAHAYLGDAQPRRWCAKRLHTGFHFRLEHPHAGLCADDAGDRQRRVQRTYDFYRYPGRWSPATRAARHASCWCARSSKLDEDCTNAHREGRRYPDQPHRLAAQSATGGQCAPKPSGRPRYKPLFQPKRRIRTCHGNRRRRSAPSGRRPLRKDATGSSGCMRCYRCWCAAPICSTGSDRDVHYEMALINNLW